MDSGLVLTNVWRVSLAIAAVAGSLALMRRLWDVPAAATRLRALALTPAVAAACVLVGRSWPDRLGGYIAIIDGLKQTETTDVALVQRIVIRVIAGHDSADNFAVFPREE